MAGEAVCCCRLPRTVAVILLMFSLALSVSCFSLRGLGNNVQQAKEVGAATVRKEMAGNILINGEEFNSEPVSASADASGNSVLPNVGLDQSEGMEEFAQVPQLKEVMVNKAAWELLNPTLHCGQTKMTFEAMGPGAADLQLDIGNGYTLPLNQVDESCGYSMQHEALGLVLVVPYDGCNVLQENGNHVVLMRWLNTPVKFTCPILQSIEAVTSNPAIHAQKPASPQRPGSLNRHKRQTLPSDQYSLYMYYYYLNWLRTYYPSYYYSYYPYYAPPATAPPASATTQPTTAPPATTQPTTAPPATTQPTTAPPATTQPTTAPPATTQSTTTPPATTTTGPNVTTTQAPLSHYTFFYPNGPNNNPDFFYYALIQHFYGRDPINPSDPMPTTTPPSTSTADTATTTTTSPVTTTTTAAPTSSTSTTTSTSTSTSTASPYPGPQSPYINYMNQPFKPYVLFDAFKKSGKLPDDQKYMPSAAYKSGFQARAYPNLYWQGVPWQNHNHPQIDWENLQQTQV